VNKRLLVILSFSLWAVSFLFFQVGRAGSANSGDLWIRTDCGPQVLMALNERGEDFSITVTSAPYIDRYQNADVHIYGPGGQLIKKERFWSEGSGSQTFPINSVGKGLYRVILNSRVAERGHFRLSTSLPKLVLGGWTEFDVWVWYGKFAKEDYFFHVPCGVSSFIFYVHRNVPGQWAHFRIFDSSNRLVLDTYFPKEDGVYMIEAPSSERGRFWRLNADHWSRTKFKFIGIPDWFSSSPASWFNPEETGYGYTFTPARIP
jgi:hypothetical protein